MLYLTIDLQYERHCFLFEYPESCPGGLLLGAALPVPVGHGLGAVRGVQHARRHHDRGLVTCLHLPR